MNFLFEDVIHFLKGNQQTKCIETGLNVRYTFHKSSLFSELWIKVTICIVLQNKKWKVNESY
jgi:hypothetical protein